MSHYMPPANPACFKPEQLAELVAAIQEVLWRDSEYEDDTMSEMVEFWDAEKARDSMSQLDAIYELMAHAGLKPTEKKPGTQSRPHGPYVPR